MLRQWTDKSNGSTDSVTAFDRFRRWLNRFMKPKHQTLADGEELEEEDWEGDEIALSPIQQQQQSKEVVKDVQIDEILSSDFDMLYELGRLVGEGEFARVRLGRCRRTGRRVALKQMNGMETTRQAKIMQEGLRHKNIVRLERVFRHGDLVTMVMEYAEGGELFGHVQQSHHLGEQEARKIMRQVFSAVEYMHLRGVVHRDLKLENILLRSDSSIVIIDFGFACRWNLKQCGSRLLERDDAVWLRTACGSPCYAAPELVLDRQVQFEF